MVASENQIVVILDHFHQSGAIDFGNGSVVYNLAGELIKAREANYARVVDLMATAHHFYNNSNFDQETWNCVSINPNETYAFGHGQGGLVAQMMVGNRIFSGGGSLNGLVKMPAPYTEVNVFYRNHTGPSKPKPGPRQNGIILDKLKRIALALKRIVLKQFNGIICRVVSHLKVMNREQGACH